VGPGDALGAVNATNLLRAVRADSVIVKPDVPLLPLDDSYLNDAQGKNLPLVASTYTDHDGLKAFYVFTYARQATNAAASFVPASLGVPGDAYVYDYFSHTGTVVSDGNSFAFTTTPAEATTGGSYFIVVPIGPSGIALLGDTNKYVSLGRKRISDLSDAGILHVTVQFAAGETNLTLAGYAPSAPFISAAAGAVNPVSYDPINHFFAVTVTPNASGTASLMLTLRPVLQFGLSSGQLQMSWPAVPGTVLEKATTLTPPADWAPATNAVITVSGRNFVTVDTTSGTAFFRLKQ
jgi:hypothetical protein